MTRDRLREIANYNEDALEPLWRPGRQSSYALSDNPRFVGFDRK